MTPRLDIAICGCGPAGLAAALFLHRAGHQVHVFERFATPRPVGSGLILQPTGLGVLSELGLRDALVALGARIERLTGRVVPSNRLVLDVHYGALGEDFWALAVHRAALFDTLHAAVSMAGVRIIPAVSIAAVERARGTHARTDGRTRRVTLLASEGASLGDFDLIVDALGANSPLAAGIACRTPLEYGALWANVPWPDSSSVSSVALEQRYRRASAMAGILPIGRRSPEAAREAAFFWSLKRSHLAAWRARGMVAWKAEVANLWPECLPAIDALQSAEQLTFAQYDHFTAQHPWSPGLVHIGDASRATSPQLGQGANMALLDACALSRALELHADLHEALRAYARMRYWHVRLFQWASATFTPFYQSDSRLLPWLRDWIAAPLSRLPVGRRVLARLVSGTTVEPIARGGPAATIGAARFEQHS